MDPWVIQPSGSASTPATYSFKVLDPAGMTEFIDLPGAGVVAVTCVITIDFSALAASNDLDFQTEEVRSFFSESARGITKCYASSARDGSGDAVKVDLTVAPSGKIKSANATAKDSKLAACIADVTKKANFPKQPGEGAATVTYEIRFKGPGPTDCPT